MDNNKPVWKRKTFWVGAVTIVAGVVQGVFGDWGGGLEKLMLGAGMIFGRAAITKLEKQVSGAIKG